VSKKRTKGKEKARDKLQSLPNGFVDAVSTVLNAPPTPEQQAKKATRKARAEERKRQKQGTEGNTTAD